MPSNRARPRYAGVMIRALVGVVLLAVGSWCGAQDDPWAEFVRTAEADHGEAGRVAAAFLAEHHPERDADIDGDLLKENLDYALRAREEFPWARDLPEELFLNDVLPYASLDETRERWRPAMYERCRAIVKDCTTRTEAVQALNRELFNEINVHYNTGRKRPNQSPSESVAQGRATCTGLSIILVDACRSVGIPARIAGVANWADDRGNHTWVEVWDNGWHFTGADEFDAKGLNRGWFVGDAKRATEGDPEHAVWATSWADTGAHFPMVWDRRDRTVPGVDVTARYAPREVEAPEGRTFVRVWATDGGERIAADVDVLGAGGEAVESVRTRAGTADLNDMPTIALGDGEAAVRVRVGDEARTGHVRTPDGPTLDIAWDRLAMSRSDAEALVDRVFQERCAQITEERAGELKDATIEAGGHKLRLLEKTFGEAPEGERSLWISMHGGGGAPTEVNDQQWQNQIKLYEPSEGIYIAPRAPTDTWNLWHQAHIDPLFDRLIESYVAARGVDPDRVYLMGYSAGGDGVFQLAPRMADRFAAAAMMAGHPNETSPLGLRDLPFALLMGGDDSAYERNAQAKKWEDELDALREQDPGGYPHRVIIYEGLGHWMQRRDAEILPWMAEHTRVAWPDRVVWRQDDVTHTRFYWLAVRPEDAKERSTIVASVEGQRIVIESEDVRRVTLRLRDGLVDLDRPIEVVANGEVVFEGHVARTERAVRDSLGERNEPGTAATATLDVAW